MESMIGPAVNVLLILTAGLVSIPWLRDAVEVSRTRVTPMAPNSNDEAQRIFLDLLNEATKEIVMYDDGDTDAGSLYQSRDVVRAMEAKIRSNPDFRVDCVLNKRTGETLFEKELASYPNVRVRQRRADPSRVHYKIVDGRKAYVSCHEHGRTIRNRRMIDCTNALSRHRDSRPLALRRYFDDFERHAA